MDTAGDGEQWTLNNEPLAGGQCLIASGPCTAPGAGRVRDEWRLVLRCVPLQIPGLPPHSGQTRCSIYRASVG